eukprot:c18215_g1_i2.p1 GENE.c18215_g1_i2~~c18215_g1_i2.p1  ORF type:complete len:387 (-),score=72.24 c18215_g1_i2:23-1150(-)
MVVIVFFGGLFALALLWALGANDVANAVGTAVGSGAVSVRQAIVLAGFFEFLGSSLMGSHVSATLSQKIVDFEDFSSEREFALGMLAALFGTFIWLTVGTFFGLPLSSTHTILGGIVGFAFVGAGVDHVKWQNIVPIILSWFVSPVLGAFISYTLTFLLDAFILNRPDATRRTQVFVPWIFSFTFAIETLFLLMGGPELIRVDLSPFGRMVVLLFITVIGAWPSKKLISMFVVECTRRRIEAEPNDTSFGAMDAASTAKESGDTPIDGTQTDDFDIEIIEAPLEGEGEAGTEADHVNAVHPQTSLSPRQTELAAQSEFIQSHFIPLMVLTACAVAFAHGGNDVVRCSRNCRLLPSGLKLLCCLFCFFPWFVCFVC